MLLFGALAACGAVELDVGASTDAVGVVALDFGAFATRVLELDFGASTDVVGAVVLDLGASVAGVVELDGPASTDSEVEVVLNVGATDAGVVELDFCASADAAVPNDEIGAAAAGVEGLPFALVLAFGASAGSAVPLDFAGACADEADLSDVVSADGAEAFEAVSEAAGAAFSCSATSNVEPAGTPLPVPDDGNIALLTWRTDRLYGLAPTTLMRLDSNGPPGMPKYISSPGISV